MSYDFRPPNIVNFHIRYVVPKKEKRLNECEVKGWVSLKYLQHSPLSHTSPFTYQLASTSLSPNNSVKWQNLVFVSSLVNISTGLLSVGIYLSVIFLPSTASQIKWYWMSMCLVHAWNLLSFDNAIAPWLSQLIVIGLSNPHISWTNVHKYITSFAAWVCAMYSASVLDNMTIYCFLELQVMAPMPIWNKYLEIECLQYVAAQPSLHHKIHPGLCFCICQRLARGSSCFQGMWLFSSHLPSGLVPDFEWIETGSWLQMLDPGVRSLQATGDIWLHVHMVHLTFKILALGSTGSDFYWTWFLGPSVYWLILHW